MAEERVSVSDVLVARKRLSGYVIPTPLKTSTWLSDISHAEIMMKLENLQVTGSFKFRGALNALTWCKEKEMSRVFTASIGNHALGIAEAGKATEREVTICMPVNAPPEKRRKLETLYSVGIIQHGDDLEATESFARRMASEKKGYFVSAYNNNLVIAGQGTVGLEIVEAVPKVSTIIVPVGGGGLAAGIGLVAKTLNPNVRIVGVVAANAPTMKQSVHQGRVVRVMTQETVADSISGQIEQDSLTFPMVQELVDEWVAVDEPDIIATIFEFLDQEGMLIEGAAATAVAAVSKKMIDFKPRERVALVVCGGNVSRKDWRESVVQHLVGSGKVSQ